MGSDVVKKGTDAFVEFTLSRIPADVRESLNDEQFSAIRRALSAQAQSSAHAIDIRIRIPLFFRSYYIVLFTGRDRRGSVFRLERYRISRLPRPVRRIIYFAATGIVLGTFLALIFMALYLIKSAAGIDIFSSVHLRDLIPFDLLEPR